jgi:GT2 family glycosyltransferase
MVLSFFRQALVDNPQLTDVVLYVYFIALLILFTFGMHGFVMVYHYLRNRRQELSQPTLDHTPVVTIQLPVYNELYVVERLIDATCSLNYPKEQLEIQVLDDSTDETVEVVARAVRRYRGLGYDIHHLRRGSRLGYKAGALQSGLERARGEFIAIFDADFVPRPEFLQKTLPYFFQNARIGLVQTRWEHLNREYSLLTRTQALALDGHFIMEQNVRNKVGYFINFNGTGGIWRKSCIEDAGNWHIDTLTEDLDLSYRAQLKGWKFKFLNAAVPVDKRGHRNRSQDSARGLEIQPPVTGKDPLHVPFNEQSGVSLYSPGGHLERPSGVHQATRGARTLLRPDVDFRPRLCRFFSLLSLLPEGRVPGLAAAIAALSAVHGRKHGVRRQQLAGGVRGAFPSKKRVRSHAKVSDRREDRFLAGEEVCARQDQWNSRR